ncbi:MAG TPA: hypothetical protein VI387_07055 [Candidatus Brocadiales bacterium]|nr:hypothetical protein [Candidatus Brocadiales bacterium]
MIQNGGYIMKNLIYKIAVIGSIMAMPMALSAINASEYYTRYTREFLGCLGHKNPSAVPVNKITPNDRYYKGAAGYASATGININEDFLASKPFSEAVKLFTCAHEATHFALGHPYQVNRKVLEIEQEADVEAARMLCKNGYTWIVQGHVDNLRRLVNAGLGDRSDGQHPTYRQQYGYLSNVLANSGKTNPVKVAPKPTPVQPAKPVQIKPNPVRKPVQVRPAKPRQVKPSPAKPVKVVPNRNANRNPVKPVVRKGSLAQVLREMQLKKAAGQRMQRARGR